ncbi:hypothetical protein AUP68_02243 [Ilyonectria robusta]
MPQAFQQWFPQFAPYFSRILRDNCSSEYHDFLTLPDPWTNYHANMVVSCILGHFDESGKAQLAAASVLLGLLPTILGMVGSNTTEIGLLALRQPVFAFLLSLGAPVISPIRSFEYRDPFELLQLKKDDIRPFVNWRRLLYFVEYLVTFTAVGNVVHVTWQLSVSSLCAFSGSSQWLPAFWFGISVIPHFFGAYAVRLRFKKSDIPIIKALLDELRFKKEPREVKLVKSPESKRYLVWSWLASAATVLHIVIGTVVLSSALFISPSDAVVVSLRFFASGVVCRIFLMFELHGMGKFVEPEEKDTVSTSTGTGQSMKPNRGV